MFRRPNSLAPGHFAPSPPRSKNSALFGKDPTPSPPPPPPLLTKVDSLMVCLTLPISPLDVAARCSEKSVSACPFSSPNTSPRAMKNGEHRKGCVSVYTSSHAPPLLF